MTNRYGTLIGSKKISEDFQTINTAFDLVQTEMDTKGTPADAQAKADAAKAAAIAAAAEALTAHKQRGADEHPTAKGNAAGFMSAADKLKSDASTNAATADTLMQRDAAGRAKVAAPAVADDIARKAETDAVQGNLDSHAADTDIHVTAADHDKLDGIEEGAQINQNAFAKVNDVVASDPSDTVTFVGGTGIVVSTNPMTNEIMLTATSEATPGAHASSHITGGSDVIPDAVTNGASGLMSGADAKFVRQDGETKTGAQAKAEVAETAAKEYTDEQVSSVEGKVDAVQSNLTDIANNQCRIYTLNNQVIPNDVETKLDISTVSYDPSSLAENGEIIIKKKGIYIVGATVRYSAHVTGIRDAIIKLNANNVANDLKLAAPAPFGQYCNPMILMNLNVGDKLSLNAYQTSGTSITVFQPAILSVSYISGED